MGIKIRINSIRKQLLNSITRHIKGESNVVDADFDLKEIKNVFISRPNSRLGNLLLVTPLIQDIERLLPHAEIDIFVRGGVGFPIFENYTQVKNLINLPKKPFKELFKYLKIWWRLRRKDYDLALNVIADSSSGRLSVELSKASFKDFGDEVEMLKERYSDYLHMAKQPVYNFRNLLAPYCSEAFEAPIPTLSFNLTAEEFSQGENTYRAIIPHKESPTIYIYTFATGSKCLTKEWWLAFYSKLVAQFPTYNIVEVLPKERVSQINFLAPTYYSVDLHEMSAVISKGALFITADCGVMHLASGSNIPVLALFNVTDINRYGPYNEGSIAVYDHEVNQEELVDRAIQILNIDSQK